MSYNRKIFYVNFYEGDEKKGNAGYIKVLENRGVQKAELRLNGISAVFDGERELEIMSGQNRTAKERIYLHEGNSAVSLDWEKGGELTELSFRVLLPGGCSLDSKERRMAPIEERVNGVEIMEKEREEVASEMPKPQMQQEPMEEMEDVEPVSTEKQEEQPEKVENRKWKQICKVYPHVRPFRDFREYIKLDLKDMVLISERKYTLVENSFLLHGYYNYDHIVLWKKEKAPVKYYIGVPGNFYEKEKQVAVLYGFESFEGAVEPAKEGDFGYYMTEVTI